MPVGVNLPSRLKPIGTKFIAMRGKLQPAAARGCGCRRAHLRRRADAPRDRWAIAKRHFVRRRRETALCGERRGPSPRDPSSVHPRASAAQLRLGVQPLRGLGSGAVPLRCRTIAVRMRSNAADSPRRKHGAERSKIMWAAAASCGACSVRLNAFVSMGKERVRPSLVPSLYHLSTIPLSCTIYHPLPPSTTLYHPLPSGLPRNVSSALPLRLAFESEDVRGNRLCLAASEPSTSSK